MAFIESQGQFYAPYWEWEDFQNGMYKKTMGGDINKAIEMFTSEKLCYETMLNVVQSWPIASKVNLTNKHSNRKAWLGWSASCMYSNLTQEETCQVWNMLTDDQREKANQIANKVIKQWEDNNNE